MHQEVKDKVYCGHDTPARTKGKEVCQYGLDHSAPDYKDECADDEENWEHGPQIYTKFDALLKPNLQVILDNLDFSNFKKMVDLGGKDLF